MVLIWSKKSANKYKELEEKMKGTLQTVNISTIKVIHKKDGKRNLSKFTKTFDTENDYEIDERIYTNFGRVTMFPEDIAKRKKWKAGGGFIKWISH